MDKFLCEVLDCLDTKDVNISDFVKDGSFSYSLLFSSEELHQTQLFNWVFKTISQVYPSKMQIKKCKTLEEISGYLGVQKISEDIRTRFNAYKEKLLSNAVFLKEEVWKKLNARGVTVSDVYDPSLTLFKQYNDSYDYDGDHKMIVADQLLVANPITKCHSTIHKQENVVEHDALTIKDAIIFSIYSDIAFVRVLTSTIVILDTEGIGGLITFPQLQKYLIISQFKCDEAHYVCPKIKSYLCAFPTLVYSSTPVLDIPTHCKFLTVSPEVRDMMDRFPYAKDDLVGNYLKNITPQYIQNHIYEYMMKQGIDKSVIDHTKTSNCIIIVDTRGNMMSAVSAMVTHYNVGWNILVCCALDVQDYYKTHLGEKVRFITHPLLNLKRALTINDYNNIMKDRKFWTSVKDCGYEYALIAQEDSMILKECKEKIKEFLKYEYVGAPWVESPYLTDAGVTNLVGNGGLSLREINAMIRITKEHEFEKTMTYVKNNMVIPEDVYFAKFAKTAPMEKAGEFAFEMSYSDALGFHKPWPYLQKDVIDLYLKKVKSME